MFKKVNGVKYLETEGVYTYAHINLDQMNAAAAAEERPNRSAMCMPRGPISWRWLVRPKWWSRRWIYMDRA